MKVFTLPVIVALQALLLMGCSTSRVANPTRSDKALARFADMLTGTFSSEKQAMDDSAYYHISLVMTPIWPDRMDGIWLYVEQAVAANPGKPYRQRVYRLTHPSPDVFQSDIYTIANPLDYAGLQADEQKRRLLTPDKIELKDGCAVTMTHRKGVYEGGTTGNGCPSDLRGATYATTKILLKDGELHSWDQGFDAAGNQVWGATKGGYIFIREKQ